MMVFSLASLYEDHQHLLNYWTTSNAGLNLIRYRGVKFKFLSTYYRRLCSYTKNMLPNDRHKI